MPVLALVLATFFWGSSFFTVGSALEYTNPLTLVMLRFGVAAFFVLLMLKGRIADIPKRTWKAGAACAFLIYLGYTTNAAGLMTLQSSESGFLTALYVPITPLLVWVLCTGACRRKKEGLTDAEAGVVVLYVWNDAAAGSLPPGVPPVSSDLSIGNGRAPSGGKTGFRADRGGALSGNGCVESGACRKTGIGREPFIFLLSVRDGGRGKEGGYDRTGGVRTCPWQG